MSYMFNALNGGNDTNGLETGDGWVPYWNLNGKYVGMKFPSHAGQENVYRNSLMNKYVSTYEELNW